MKGTRWVAVEGSPRRMMAFEASASAGVMVPRVAGRLGESLRRS